MKKLVFFPSDPIEAYIEKGRTYEFLDNYYNPGGLFDEVYCLSPWGEKREKTIGKIHYIMDSPSRYRKIIRELQPDVVRGYGGYCCADWVSISKVKGIPTLVSVHDTNPDLIHESLKYADGIICMSETVKNQVKKIVPNVTSNIWVMPNRIDLDTYKYREDFSYFEKLNEMFPGKKHILHVGRKSPQKNLDTVIKAMKYLDKDIVTVFVGQGNVQEYNELAISEGVADRCYFVKRVESSELPLWYSWCDCMCTPSRWEGFGYVFIEAAACESAIITSNIAPMNEYLTNGENSILLDEYENPRVVAEAIRRVLENTDDIKNMKNKARNVGMRFKKEVIDQREMEIYREIMDIGAGNKYNYKLREITLRKEWNDKIKSILH